MESQKKMLKFALFALLICGSLNVNAQVTIGTQEAPVSGALLDLKEYADRADSVSANHGVVLPRVRLQNIYTLAPLVTETETDAIKKAHIGLTVYNLTYTDPFTSGIYFWNGSRWVKQLSALGSWFYMPPFPLNVEFTSPVGAAANNKTVNLSETYKKQFYPIVPTHTKQVTGTPLLNTVVPDEDYNFYVVGYDETVFDAASISLNVVGSDVLLHYTVKESASDSTYMNIIMVRK
jgi:hypothetical protein